MDISSVGGRVLPRWAVNFLWNADALVLLTERQGAYLHEKEGVGRRQWQSTREVVIPNGIPMLPRYTEDDRLKARATLGVDEGDIVVGVVGRLSVEKAPEVLFEAAARCLPDSPQLRLVLVGDGDRRGELEELAERLGIAHRTSFLGTRRDVPDLLAGFDLFCLSSIHEGVPIAIIEALAAGLPVLASDCGSVGDIVGDGEQGFLFPVRGVEILADRLQLLVGDAELRARLGAAGRARAEQEFSVERTARRYEQLCTQLVGDGP
jgi:glycosyltransferase involved in cell wall biosynthesis